MKRPYRTTLINDFNSMNSNHLQSIGAKSSESIISTVTIIICSLERGLRRCDDPASWVWRHSLRKPEKHPCLTANQYWSVATLPYRYLPASGHRYPGAVRGSREFKAEYVKKQNSPTGKSHDLVKTVLSPVHPTRPPRTQNIDEPLFWCAECRTWTSGAHPEEKLGGGGGYRHPFSHIVKKGTGYRKLRWLINTCSKCSSWNLSK